ncbi:MAG: hypothetical protein EU548_03790 [Promethearchaeota archaeon]|nr:MAG: hypothetical protein EU548_03790 [Candidatus Lokiarchaeota archaeon]
MENEKYYDFLAKRLDSTIQGLSKMGTDKISDTWMEYLRTLIPSELVKYIIELPIFPAVMSIRKFARKINKSENEATKILEELFNHDCVMRVGSKKKKYAIHLPLLLFDVPPLSYHKYPKKKAKKLASLSIEYLENEEWYKNFEGSPETPLTRVIPVQESIPVQQNILPYEDVEKIIDDSKLLSLQDCACRLRLEYLGKRKCDYPLETCIGVNQGAKYFIERGHGREISKEEAKKLLKKLNKLGLVHTTENFREGNHTLICSCCSCCCNLIGGITRYDNPRAVAAANYLAKIKNIEECQKCELCVEKCSFKAIKMGDNGPIIDESKCMGCGVCIVNCPNQIIELERIKREKIYKDIIQLGLKVAKETDREIKLF